MLGWSCSSAEDVLGRGDECDDWPPTGSNRFNEQSRGRGLTEGCNNQLGTETEGGNTTIISLSSPGLIQGHRQPVLPPNTTINSSHLCSLSRTNGLSRMNGGRDHLQQTCKTNNNQPKKVEAFVANLIAVLCVLVFIVIILILSPNLTSNSTVI
jgi:hypothetical protein